MQPIKFLDTASSQKWIPIPSYREVKGDSRDSTQWAETLKIYSAVIGLESRVRELERKVERSVCLSTQISDLNNSKYELRSPISVLIAKENQEYYAEAVDLNIYGIGEDEKEAIENFKEMLVLYYENLKSSKKKLSRNLRAKLVLLKKIIIDEN